MGRITISISHPRDATKRIRAQIHRPGCAATTNTRIEFIPKPGATAYESYGSGSGPKSGGGMRCFVAASYAEAIRKSVGSEKGRPKNMIPSGSFAGMGPMGAFHQEPRPRGLGQT